LLKPVPFTAVHCHDHFWAPRIEVNRSATIQAAFQKCEESGRVDLFRRAAATLKGDENVDKTPPGYAFDDSDVYKVIEGAAYSLSVHPDPELEAYADGLIEIIGAAQEPDGYLYTTRTIDPEHPHRAAGTRRWEMERAHSHELYNLGHLYEAAVAYYQATGKRELLDVALKSAGLLDHTFGPEPGKEAIWPGHQITELALVKLYRATGDERYLRLAGFMLESRGPDGHEGSGKEYNQSHKPVADQAEAVGHAVRATYMYAGMADVAALTDNASYIEALDRIWEDVAGRKLYVTGGIGASGDDEAFGQAYMLPNSTAYSETCAAIGNVFWNGRMLLLHEDARYVDVLERTLYNALLVGVSLEGTLFFYDNPLESSGEHARSPWFKCACCPTNVARFLPSLPGYVYAQRAGTIYANLFVGSTAEIAMEDGRVVRLEQETLYPWDGKVRLAVHPKSPGRFTIKWRIPGWARNEAVPSGLYRFLDSATEPAKITVNGQQVDLQMERGYATLERDWQAGDVIDLDLHMPVRRIVADNRVEADRGKVALQRGPIVYCLEQADNPGIDLQSLSLPDAEPLQAEFEPDLLGGVVALKGRASMATKGPEPAMEGRKTNEELSSFTAIPYYAWANRGPGQMAVWLPRT
jgi:DUF1680 family protein